jgi:uncharacterized membrane protein YfcA
MNTDNSDLILTALILLAALLYSSVGHAGASGYLAAMALMGLSPAVMKPAALALNILVAIIATVRFYRAGAFSWRLFWPLALASTPCAFLGGLLTLPGHWYKMVVGIVLLFAAWRSFHGAAQPDYTLRTPARLPLLTAGAALGLLSGLTGVGGGIFLSPLLLLMRWAEIKTIAGISAAFILVNSIAGLLGVMTHAPALPSALPLWALAAVMGGFIGAGYGSQRLGNPALRRMLALVLVIAGVKMLATA